MSVCLCLLVCVCVGFFVCESVSVFVNDKDGWMVFVSVCVCL